MSKLSKVSGIFNGLRDGAVGAVAGAGLGLIIMLIIAASGGTVAFPLTAIIISLAAGGITGFIAGFSNALVSDSKSKLQSDNSAKATGKLVELRSKDKKSKGVDSKKAKFAENVISSKEKSGAIVSK